MRQTSEIESIDKLRVQFALEPIDSGFGTNLVRFRSACDRQTRQRVVGRDSRIAIVSVSDNGRDRFSRWWRTATK